MGLDYRDLDDTTRQLMIDEIERDARAGTAYVSPRLTEAGVGAWLNLVADAARDGSDESLAIELARGGWLKTHEVSHRRGVEYLKSVPSNAPETLAQGEFNRYYLRALAQRAIDEGRDLEIYRARASSNPRPESEALVGARRDPADLLEDLRSNDVNTALRLPPGPNSGLSARLI